MALALAGRGPPDPARPCLGAPASWASIVYEADAPAWRGPGMTRPAAGRPASPPRGRGRGVPTDRDVDQDPASPPRAGARMVRSWDRSALTVCQAPARTSMSRAWQQRARRIAAVPAPGAHPGRRASCSGRP